jgi:hypothetical protein
MLRAKKEGNAGAGKFHNFPASLKESLAKLIKIILPKRLFGKKVYSAETHGSIQFSPDSAVPPSIRFRQLWSRVNYRAPSHDQSSHTAMAEPSSIFPQKKAAASALSNNEHQLETCSITLVSSNMTDLSITESPKLGVSTMISEQVPNPTNSDDNFEGLVEPSNVELPATESSAHLSQASDDRSIQCTYPMTNPQSPEYGSIDDRERTKQRYVTAAEELKKAVQLHPPGWEIFELPPLSDISVVDPIPQMRSEIDKILASRMNSANNQSIWSKGKNLVEKFFTVLSPFAKHFLLVAREAAKVS